MYDNPAKTTLSHGRKRLVHLKSSSGEPSTNSNPCTAGGINDIPPDMRDWDDPEAPPPCPEDALKAIVPPLPPLPLNHSPPSPKAAATSGVESTLCAPFGADREEFASMFYNLTNDLSTDYLQVNHTPTLTASTPPSHTIGFNNGQSMLEHAGPEFSSALDSRQTKEAAACSCTSLYTSRISWVSSPCVCALGFSKLTKIIQVNALAVPPPDQIQKLARYFFTYAHVTLPVVSEREIYLAMHPQPDAKSPTQISPALLYTILFEGSAVSRDPKFRLSNS
jgi:hypothetical protein